VQALKEILAYGIFALFFAYLAVAIGLLILSIVYFTRALGRGDSTKLPKYLAHNPLNVLLDPGSLSKEGIRLRNKGVRCCAYFVLLVFVGIVLQEILLFFAGLR
jgi:hypothetical protein